LDYWGHPHQKVATKDILPRMRTMRRLGANFNIYMFHGGTSFGFVNGADAAPFRPEITSYDYDAPLTEAGDTTNKYEAIR
jgi:hypothetical protein